jgi:hypothetical protein
MRREPLDHHQQYKLLSYRAFLGLSRSNSMTDINRARSNNGIALCQLGVGFLLFLTPSAFSATVSEYHAVTNGRDTPDSGRCGGDFWRRLDGGNAPICGHCPRREHGCTRPLEKPSARS